MWRYYRRTFWAVQLFALVVGGMVYSSTKPVLGPALFVVLFMQASALVGAAWAYRLSKKLAAWNAACPIAAATPTKVTR